MASKNIIVVGDVLGKFSVFFKRLKKTKENNEKRKFDFVMCVGNFFSLNDDEDSEDHNLTYIAREFDVGLPIYVLGPTTQSQKRFYKPLFTRSLTGVPTFEEGGYDLAVNVTYLGKRGLYSTIDGIKILYLSGLESETSSDCSFNLSDIDELIFRCSSAGRIDFLLTTSFPYRVNENSHGGKSSYLNRLNDEGSILVSKLAKSILPRYHFSASPEEFWEREPYRNHLILNEQPKIVTRFISMAKVRDAQIQQKWIYAFCLTAAKDMKKSELLKQPDDSTENPYIVLDFDKIGMIKKERNISDNGSFFFQDQACSSNQQNGPKNRSNNNANQNNNRDTNRNQRQSNQMPGNNLDANHQQNSFKRTNTDNGDSLEKRPRLIDSNNCWFCLANPKAEKHLIISIGDHVYLTLAKGGLVDDHFLIVPIKHEQSIANLMWKKNEQVLNEIGKFKNAIIDYFNSKDKVAVFFERNFKSGHLQLQAVALPRDKSNDLLDVLLEECKRRQLNLREMKRSSTIKEETVDNAPYFYIESRGRRFIIGIRLNLGFAINFGRELLADPRLLNCEDRIEWRNCELDIADAKQLAVDIRKDFKPFDFTDL